MARSELVARLWARKSVDEVASADVLPRVLSRWDLTALGVGAVIGAGFSPPPARRSPAAHTTSAPVPRSSPPSS